MNTTTAFSWDEYLDILEKSEFKLEYRAGEIYTMWGEIIEEREGQLVMAESGIVKSRLEKSTGWLILMPLRVLLWGNR